MRKTIRVIVIGAAVLALLGISGWAQQKPKTLMETGIDYYKAGQYPEAIEAFKAVIRNSTSDKESQRAYIYLGYTYFSLQELENAKIQIDKAITLDPDFSLSEDEFVADFIGYYKKAKEGLTGIGFFESLPPKANVYLDKTLIGVTPLKKELLSKSYTLRFVKAGYTSYEMSMEIQKTVVSNFKIDLNLQPNWKTFLRSTLVFIAAAYLSRAF